MATKKNLSVQFEGAPLSAGDRNAIHALSAIVMLSEQGRASVEGFALSRMSFADQEISGSNKPFSLTVEVRCAEFPALETVSTLADQVAFAERMMLAWTARHADLLALQKAQ